MIRLWVLLNDEPPTTKTGIGQMVSFTCRWAAAAESIVPEEFRTQLPQVNLVEREGVPRIVSGESQEFEAYPDYDLSQGFPPEEWVHALGVACEDKYLEPFLRRSVPEFSGVIEAVRYLWSPDWPSGVVEQVTADSANPAPGQLYGVGKLVQVIVE